MGFILLAFLGGVAVAFQVGINSQLKTWLNHPLQATLISFTIGAVSLFIYNLFLNVSWPEPDSLLTAPWWVWLGGVLGSFYVFTTVFLASKLEATMLIGLVVFGQMIVSLLMDHYGLFGFAQQRINLLKIFGVLLMIAGLILVKTN